MINIEEYLTSKGIDIIRDDGTELACYCPFHSNTDTPAFYINKYTGLWNCFNPGCGKRGSLKSLMIHYGDKADFVKDYTYDEIEELLRFKKEDHEDNSWGEMLDKIRVQFPDEAYKVQYLIDRGYDIETLDHFEIGWSGKKERIVIPVRDEHYKVVGFVGRTPHKGIEPKYMNSKGLPKRYILFNLNNAKRFNKVIVCEGPLDAIKIHQCGYENVVASFGANITENQISLLREYFDTVVIFSDNDPAGYMMRNEIIKHGDGLEVLIPRYPSRLIVDSEGERPIKDPGEMTAEEVVESVENAEDYFMLSLL